MTTVGCRIGQGAEKYIYNKQKRAKPLMPLCPFYLLLTCLYFLKRINNVSRFAANNYRCFSNKSAAARLCYV